MTYTTISISDLREQLPEVTERVARKGEIFVVEKWGKIKGYLVPSLAIASDEEEDRLIAARKKSIKRAAGMWSDVQEMQNSVKWVRNIRRKSSSRYGKVFN